MSKKFTCSLFDLLFPICKPLLILFICVHVHAHFDCSLAFLVLIRCSFIRFHLWRFVTLESSDFAQGCKLADHRPIVANWCKRHVRVAIVSFWVRLIRLFLWFEWFLLFVFVDSIFNAPPF